MLPQNKTLRTQQFTTKSYNWKEISEFCHCMLGTSTPTGDLERRNGKCLIFQRLLIPPANFP